jgi:hypothetical protein
MRQDSPSSVKVRTEKNNSPERIWKFQQMIYAEILEELDRHFSELKVRYMPIKGAYLICSGLAEKMKYRRMDDIDILVKKADFKRVCDFFSHLPQATFLNNSGYFEKKFTYSLGRHSCLLEFHYLINHTARFDLPPENLFERAPEGFGMKLLPCREDALLIFLCHELMHISFEIRKTIFEEIELLTMQPCFSWELFWRHAEKTGIEQFLCLLLLTYEKEKGKKIPLPPLRFKTKIVQPFLSNGCYHRLSRNMKRCLFEFPFVVNPWRLLIMKK